MSTIDEIKKENKYMAAGPSCATCCYSQGNYHKTECRRNIDAVFLVTEKSWCAKWEENHRDYVEHVPLDGSPPVKMSMRRWKQG